MTRELGIIQEPGGVEIEILKNLDDPRWKVAVLD
jgi:hypothetical protein